MARLALLADIHGNREAFDAVLADLAARDAGRIVLLGDIVGYGADPVWCAARAQALVSAGAIAVRGNHDDGLKVRDPAMSANARAALDWTRDRLSPDLVAFLTGLPLTETRDDVLFVHASANAPADWIYVTGERTAYPSFSTSRARLIFCGHVHVPALYSCDGADRVQAQRAVPGMAVPLLKSRRWLSVLGSVGQPRDGIPEAAYAILDTDRNELTFRRVPYDREGAAAKVRAAGLPETLALRLIRGS